MHLYTPITVSPEYLRDNQYNSEVKIVNPDYNMPLFQDLLDEHGSEMLSYFPSGKEVFFCVRSYGVVNHSLRSENNTIDNLSWGVK